jgi:hypothetical protein
MAASLSALLLKFHLILYCHFYIECWQIGGNIYNCDGQRICE